MTLLQLALDPLWSLLFPGRCLLCGQRHPRALCEACHDDVARETAARPGMGSCARCEHPLRRGASCPDCDRLRAPSFERVYSVGPYRGLLKELVLVLKYRDGWRLAEPLAAFLYERLRAQVGQVDCVTSIPIDPARRALRGYNQSELIASRLAVRLGRPHIRGLLGRTVEGVVQSSANVAERHQQALGIFEARRDVAGRKVLVVDDVMTTAATMHAAGQVLRSAGARVWGAVVARQTLRQM